MIWDDDFELEIDQALDPRRQTEPGLGPGGGGG